MIDTHCHLAFESFEGRIDQIVADAVEAGVRGMITVSTTTSNCIDNLNIAKRFDNVWCTAGVHPLHSDEPRNWEDVRKIAEDPKCVAWGELGLDNHYVKPVRSDQDKALEEQLAFIESCQNEGLTKPIVVHCRKAFDDLIPVFKNAPFDPSRFVFHCFTGTPDDARKVLDFGAWISFTGVVTFKNAQEVAEAAKLVPSDRIMVETDSPFLTPAPMRKIWPCEPKFVIHTAQFIAELRNENPQNFEILLDSNAEGFFNIKLP